MNKIRTQNTKPGMRLATDVKNHHGVMILAKGCRLTKQHIDIFRMWGIVEIEVEDKPDATLTKETQPIDKVKYKKAREKAMKRYQLTNVDHPAMVEIFNLFLDRVINQKGERASHA